MVICDFEDCNVMINPGLDLYFVEAAWLMAATIFATTTYDSRAGLSFP